MKNILSIMIVLMIVLLFTCGCNDTSTTTVSISSEKESSASDPTGEISLTSQDISQDVENVAAFNSFSDISEYCLHYSLNNSVVDVESEYQLYSRFGDNVYVCDYDDAAGEDVPVNGSKLVNGSDIKAVYPRAFGIYEYDGNTYALSFEHDCDFEIHYGKLNSDGSFERMLNIDDIYYINGKIYYYTQASGVFGDDYCVFSSNPDGSERKAVSDAINNDAYVEAFLGRGKLIYGYGDNIVYFKSKDMLECVDGEGNTVWSLNVGQYDEVEFVSNECVYVSNTFLVKVNEEVRYELYRIPIDTSSPELLFTANILTDRAFLWGENGKEKAAAPQTDRFAIPFGNKLLVIVGDDIYVFENDFSSPDKYEFDSDSIKQIAVINQQDFALVYSDGHTAVYDSNGDMIEYR